ncbi:2Fe-2S iron-sulfur cluster-binding protein [Fimbriiglobus ruber]|uniref:Ferredoxin, 2Fe-2S n=1 Tax=Fimbriiglobus ruber TaxID=1908690 RepID=A0A225DZC1_9BACT|nr:2Fe-2S iron-sulfur cluster-binding protein [Fimbriiglobus ruber]OWK43106.1 Ferredoxin, 2Fe-2S [Fimbriiglobus ruber]
MGGVNPYITKTNHELPKQPFKITFVVEETNERTEFVVDPNQIPYGRTGLDGSILDLAEGAGVPIDHACGGVCACATCHVYVSQGLETCPSATDDEEDMLDTARAVTPESRLSCQCVPNGTKDVVVVIPEWNKNLVKEGH